MSRDADILAAVSALVAELRGAPIPVGLDQRLDRDLGLDSLSRIELIARLEQRFAVTLPDTVFANAETPRDLLAGIEAASAAVEGGPPRSATPAPAFETVAAAGGGHVPESAETLIDVLDAHAARTPQRVHITLYEDDGEGEAITFDALRRGAARMAAGLQALGLEGGEAVVLMLPTGRDYFFTFFGVLMAGGVPVPVYPPGRPAQLEEHMRRHAAIVGNCRAPVMVTVAEAKPFAVLLTAQVESLRRVVTPDDVVETATPFRPPVARAGDTAFIQYTSGSTGAPKGVVLSHANLLANVRAMGQAAGATADDVFVSWLPLYHDMGLIGAWFGSLYYGAHLVVMSPLAFLARPGRWLAAIHRYRGTLSAAPNFAYELCVHRIDDAELAGIDLSSWRCALNGAEAVSPATVAAFAERFAAHGFRREAVMPVYGLAENSVGLAFPPLGRGPVIDRVRREAFMETGRAFPAPDDDATALAFPSCGRALPGHEIRVVDAAGFEVPDRREGRIHFRGPSATAGYLRDPEKTADLFVGDWLDTGDLGYLVDGELYVTGRIKDVVIRRGRNIYPSEIEEAVGGLDGVQAGNVAVFGSADVDGATERLIVLAETRKRTDESRRALVRAINALVTDLTGSPPDEVVLAPPRSVPKTSSGKIRRSHARALFEAGAIGKPAVAVWWQVVRLGAAGIGPWLRRRLALSGAVLFAGYVWVLAALLAPLTWLGVVLAPVAAWRWAVARAALGLLALLTGTRWRVRGRENLPPDGVTVIIAANHMSYLDGPLLAGVLGRPLRFVAKGELADSVVAGLPLRRLGTLFVERFDRSKGAQAAERLARAVGEGTTVAFPEGTFTRQAGLLPFRLGAFAAAVQAGVPVVPVAIRGTRAMLRGDSFFPRPGRIEVVIGPPLSAAADSDPWHAGLALRDAVRAFILGHVGEPDLGYERAAIFDRDAEG